MAWHDIISYKIYPKTFPYNKIDFQCSEKVLKNKATAEAPL